MLKFVNIFSTLEFGKITYGKSCDRLEWEKPEPWRWVLDVARIHWPIVLCPIDRLLIHHSIYRHSNQYEYEYNRFVVEQVRLKREWAFIMVHVWMSWNSNLFWQGILFASHHRQLGHESHPPFLWWVSQQCRFFHYQLVGTPPNSRV
jgi:hypothetical protein